MDVVAGCQHRLKPLVFGIYGATIDFKGIFIVPVKAKEATMLVVTDLLEVLF